MSGTLHRVAMGLLVEDERVLLGHRHPDRAHYPDCWDGIGGHIEAGESPHEALVRECHEEVGVVVTHARPLAMVTLGLDLELHPFVVEGWTGTPTNHAPQEHDDLRWYRLDEIAGLHLAHPGLTPLVRTALAGSGPDSRAG